jgi:hypothetical protein
MNNMILPKRNHMNNIKNKIFDFDYKYTQPDDGIKPDGVWYSCNDAWYNWTQENGMLQHKYIHKINIYRNVMTNINNKNKDKILVINNLKDFDLFNKKYGYNAWYGKKFWKEMGGGNYLIKWDKVANDYGGIEICPYLTKRRYYLWYNLFDVASGCVWNTKHIIKNSELIYEKRKGKYYKVSA